MSSGRKWPILLGGAVGIFLLVVVVIAAATHLSNCGGSGPPPETGIDAGPGLQEIAEREREAERRAAERLEDIERKRREDIARIEASRRREYEEVRRAGPDAVLDWFRRFDREHFSDGGVR